MDVIHDVAEAAEHAVGARGDLLGVLVHDVINVAALGLGLFLLRLAEAVAEPAHDEARLEGERLVLPDARGGVAVHAHAALRVGGGVVGVELVLPEAAAKDAGLVGEAGTHADHAKLAVAAANDDGRALGKAGVSGALGVDVTGELAALLDGAEDVGAQAAALGDGRVPVAGLEAHDAGGRAVGGLDGQLAGELVDEPVVEHADAGGLLVDLGHLVLDPQQAREGAEGVGLAALAVELYLKLRVHGDEFAHLVV